MWVMGIDDTLTGELVRRILTAAKPDRIILFGSAATGAMTRDSDIDVIVISTRRFEETKNIFGGITYPAHKYGRTLYEAA